MRNLRARSWKLALAIGLLTSGLAYWTVKERAMPAAMAAERHPHIHQAIRELRESKRELQTAATDFGGHRVAALAAVDGAIEQLQTCLKYDKK
jgi:hypothetical protein